MKNRIPHSRPTLGPAEAEAVRQVILSGQLAQGQEVAAFEAELAAFVGRRRGVAVSSGTAGLHLALLALGLGPGDEVVIPSYTCAALIHAVRAAGAVPVAADIDPETRNLDPQAVRKRVNSRTRALIVPHLFGLPAPVEELERLGIPLIEDCAMALGGEHQGRPLGSFGILSVCSFYATKMIATAEGGMVLTDEPDLAEAIRQRREYDGLPAHCLRFNYKLTDLAAALGRVQLRRLPEFVARRRALARQYSQAFGELPLVLPPATPEHVYYRYVVRVREKAEDLIAALEERGVAARRPIFYPLHRELGEDDQAFPHATAAFVRDVSLPLYPSLATPEVEQVIAAVQAALSRS